MPHDFERSAAAMVAGTSKAIAAAMAPLERRIAVLEAIPAPRAVSEAIIDRNGVLVLTLSDGTTKTLGPVVGKDGDPGTPGQNGRDGFSLNGFDADLSEDGRTIVMSFSDDTQRFEYEMKFPIPIYRGVYSAGAEYEAGDMVSFGGSVWHCREATSDKPGTDAWQLCVKKGRDGKNA